MNVMKWTLTALVASMTTSAFAQQGESVLKLPRETNESNFGYASRGARLSIAKPLLSYEMTQDLGGRKAVTTQTGTNAFGVSIGYVSLPIYEIGWTTDFTAISLGTSNENQYSLRLAGNIAAAVSPSFYVKSGLNLSQTLGKRTLNGVETETRPGLGFQTGVGYQLNQRLGLEANYVWMNQANNVGGELFQQGVEVAISGTY